MKGVSADWALGFLTVGLRAATLASKLLLVLFLARTLPASELGLFGLMVAAAGFGVVALGVEFHAFAIRELISADDARRATMLRDQAVFFVISAALVLPLMLAFFQLDILPWQLLVWFYPLLVLEYLAHEATRVLIALSRPTAGYIVLFIRSAAWVYFVIGWFFWSGGATITTVWILWLVGVAASVVVAVVKFGRMPWRHVLHTPVNWRWIGQGIRTAPPFLITAAAALSLMYIDRFFIRAYQDLSALGVYTFFSGIAVGLHTLVQTGVLSLRIPRIVSASRAGDTVKFEQEMSSLLKATAAGALIIVAPAVLAIYPMVWIIGRPEYIASVGVFFVLLAGTLVRCIAEVFVYRLYARHQDLHLLAVNGLSFAVVLVGNLMLVPVYGIMGAATANVVAALSLGFAAFSMRHAKSRTQIFHEPPSQEGQM